MVVMVVVVVVCLRLMPSSSQFYDALHARGQRSFCWKLGALPSCGTEHPSSTIAAAAAAAATSITPHITAVCAISIMAMHVATSGTKAIAITL